MVLYFVINASQGGLTSLLEADCNDHIQDIYQDFPIDDHIGYI